MSREKLLLLAVLAGAAFAAGYGAVANAWPMPGFTRSPNYGYFLNDYDPYGTNVWPPDSDTSGCIASGGNALPTSVNTASEFINFVKCKLNSNNSYIPYRNAERTGAAFIIQTMIGTGTSRPPTAAQMTEWESRVNFAATMGWINWSATYGYTINTYWQGSGSGANPNDDAFYGDSGSGLAITFRNAAGTIVYGIRRQCANPVGTGSFAPIPNNPDFNMSGASSVNNSSPAPGQQIQFTHTLTSSGATSPMTIDWITQNTRNGNSTVASGDAGTFTANQTKTPSGSTETYTVPLGTAAGTQICRRIYWTPDTSSGGNDAGAQACAVVQANFNLQPNVSVRVDGSVVPGNAAQPGQNITFRYTVINNDNGASSGTNCTIYGLTRTGYYQVPNPIDSTSDPGFVQPSHGCPRNFPGNSSTIMVTELIPAGSVVADRTFCRSLFINPATPGGGSLGTEVCAYVRKKPYPRVYGGDVAAGGGLATSPGVCAQDTAAAIIGWNNRDLAQFGGAGVQFAAYALGEIFDAATSLGNTGGAFAPSGLSFANTTTSIAAGRFGGSFGSVPCADDHYATMPASVSALAPSSSITALGSGSYGATGNIRTLGGLVSPGEKINIYVDGNLYIDGNLIYDGDGSWTSGDIPMLRVVVLGSIFIDNDVTRLDGLFVAQPNAGAGGVIYTCTSGADPYNQVPLSGAVGSDSVATVCDDAKLTVNGSLVARQIRLLRTVGTLAQSDVSEAPGSANIAEEFDYGPASWISQPFDDAGATDYDAINSLPPIL